MIVSATGHRLNKLPWRADEKLRPVILRYLGGLEVTEAITGMAFGWDMIWAETCLGVGIPLVCAVPFDGHPPRYGDLRDRYESVLRRASRVEVVSPGGYEVWKFQVRNEWMVDRSDRVCAWWNGSAGGTANCVRYAEKVGRVVENLYRPDV